MKKIFLFSAIVLLNTVMVSCTADGVADDVSHNISADGGPGGQGGTIPPPPPPPPNPPGTGGGTGG